MFAIATGFLGYCAYTELKNGLRKGYTAISEMLYATKKRADDERFSTLITAATVPRLQDGPSENAFNLSTIKTIASGQKLTAQNSWRTLGTPHPTQAKFDLDRFLENDTPYPEHAEDTMWDADILDQHIASQVRRELQEARKAKQEEKIKRDLRHQARRNSRHGASEVNTPRQSIS